MNLDHSRFVCNYVTIERTEVRKGARNKGGRQWEVGIQAEMQEQIKYEGTRKQAGMQGESKEV